MHLILKIFYVFYIRTCLFGFSQILDPLLGLLDFRPP